MKKTKLLALLLAVAMLCMMLAACGSSTTSTTTTDTTAADSTESTAEESGETSDVATVEVDPLTIMFSTTYNQTESGGQIIQHFIDTIEEMSGGNITVDMYWGGTLFTDAEALDGVSSGSVNMTALGHMPHLATLNYLAFPGFAPGSSQAALDYFDELMFNNEETSALIQQEAADNNIIYLNVLAGGANAFCAKYEFTDLDSLIANCSSFGNLDAAIFEDLGFQVSAISPSDSYDALQRGLIDATQMGFAPMVSMSWQDVASYWALDGTYTAGNMFTANLDWWNGLTDAQREVIQAAADDVEAYSAELYNDAIAADQATVEASTGNAFVEFSQEDIDRFWAACFEAKAESAMETATANGKAEGMTKILEVAAEITGYDWVH
jgi:TRAP-type C4-dicarboxylate transport system substrate-binding protein